MLSRAINTDILDSGLR